MGKMIMRKFGVKQILGDYRELKCKECGKRAGEHYGNGEICPRDDSFMESLNEDGQVGEHGMRMEI